ncbi:MAG: flagellar biosynthetic protein FliO [Pseudomonadota bacterium]
MIERPYNNAMTAILLLVSLNNAAFAAPRENVPENLIISQGLQVCVALAVTVGAIWLLSRLAMNKNWHRSSPEKKIRILDSVAIGARDKIVLIEVANQQILLGSTPGQIRPLHTFERPLDGSFAESFNDAASQINEVKTYPEDALEPTGAAHLGTTR